MDPQSLDLQGFSEARVEMKVAPFRALTPEAFYFRFSNAHCRNEGRPFQGIDTSSFITKTSHIIYVEMKVAPFRALTHLSCVRSRRSLHLVEMKVAPFRAFLDLYMH